MTRKQYRFWINDEKMQIFLDDKKKEFGEFTSFCIEIFTLVMENKLDASTLLDLQRQKLLADIDYKKISTEFMRAKLKYTFNFDALPSKQGSHAIKQNIQKKIEEGEMQSVQTISFYDEKNYRFQCSECGILFPFTNLGERVQKKSQFVDHFMQVHRTFTKAEQEELKFC